MPWFRVNFSDKNGDEFRSLTVEAADELDAENRGCEEADNRGWPQSFKMGDVEQVAE